MFTILKYLQKIVWLDIFVILFNFEVIKIKYFLSSSKCEKFLQADYILVC